MRAPHFQKAWAFALKQLHDQLLPELTYHSYHHTIEVANSTIRLAHLGGVSALNCQLLLTAACFHDLGFTRVQEVSDLEYDKRFIHEETAASTAELVLPDFGFNSNQVAQVQRLILATRFPANPQDQLEEIICDADLSSIGLPTPQFLQSSLALRAELAVFGMSFSDQNWWQRQVNFLQDHHFFTASAQRLFDEQKSKNLQGLYHLLGECSS